MIFALTAAQDAAMDVLGGIAKHIMLFGGSRSGKTFLICYAIATRAIKAPGSRHCILRFRFNHLKASIISDTWPKMMQTCFPGVPWDLNKTDWVVRLNGSEIWFGGLDDKKRTEKILGQEHVTIYLNECSQIELDSVDMAVTRLAQAVTQEIDGRTTAPLMPRMYYDCNPPNKAHWSYQRFILKRDPDTKKTLANAADYVSAKLNPVDNVENLAAGYLDTLRGLSARQRLRFLDGDFADATPNQLFKEDDIERWRVYDADELPEAVRVVVAVDPSGSDDIDNADNDEIGIVVAGLGTDGNAYVLEDVSCRTGPAKWGRITVDAFERNEADIVVGETNYGGAMVKHVVQTARRETPFKKVTSSRGKAIRAEPFSALFEQGRIRFFGRHPKLEDELCAMSTYGYTGRGSPNRADALVFALTELFPKILAGPKQVERKAMPRRPFDRETGI